jgi:hypothetical protein
MIVSPAVFGFSGLKGPQIFVTSRYALKPAKRTLGAYVKYAPVSQNYALADPIKNREVALGFNLTELHSGKNVSFLLRPWTFSADLSDLRLQFQGSEIISRTASLSVSTPFHL